MLLQAQLGRRHSPGFPLPPYQPDKLNASRSDSIPEEAVVGNEQGHMGPMGSREVLLQVCGLLAALLSIQFPGLGHVTESMSLYANHKQVLYGRVSIGSVLSVLPQHGMQCWRVVLLKCEQQGSQLSGYPLPVPQSVLRSGYWWLLKTRGARHFGLDKFRCKEIDSKESYL